VSVLILMYHRTPLSDVESDYDVPIGAFKTQVQAMADAGVRFIPLSQTLDPRNYGEEVVVSITFDDGDRTNLGAFEVLAELGIPSTAMIVSQFCTERPADFMTPDELIAAPDICEFGAHGHTHTNLAALAPHELKVELSNSKRWNCRTRS
jgi:peptidoglycan/xylan/chitin deacetylase (PgdA/CDA1 family)